MNDIFAKWREAVSGNCDPISGDEVCAGYYRIPSDGVRLERRTNTEQMDQLTSQPWLPVALWIDEDSGQMKGLLDGENVNPSVIWSLCRQSPVPYDAYRAVAELGHEWPYSVTGTQSSHENGEASDEDLNSISTQGSQKLIDLPGDAETFARSGNQLSGSEIASHGKSSQAQKSHNEPSGVTSQDQIADYVPASVASKVSAPSPQNLGFQNAEVADQMTLGSNLQTVRHQDAAAGIAKLYQAPMSGSVQSGNSHPKASHQTPLSWDHAPLGHNQQSVGHHEILAEMLAALSLECETWLMKTGRINDQDTANQAGHFAERYSALEKEAEEARTLEKRPALEWGRAIDGKWKPIVTAAAEGKKSMKRAVEPFLISERLRIEEEARTEGLLTSALVAPKAGLYGRKVGLRATYVMQVTDEASLIETFRNDPRLWRDHEVRLAMKRLAEADLRAGREVTGAELVQELTAA